MREHGAGCPSIRLVVAIFQHKNRGNRRCTSRGTFPGDEKPAAHAFGGKGEDEGDDTANAF